jgi:hypothetical protein
MADVKITELPEANIPNAATVVPCVIQGTTKKLSLANLKTFLDIPTIFVRKVQASDPLETVPASGIVGEGSISIREASPLTPGSMSKEHYNRVQDATYSTVATRLVIRDSTGSFKANNIELVGISPSDASGTISGNLSQRKATDTGVNAKLGETTRYTAKVTSLNADGDVSLSQKLDVVGGPFKVGTGGTASTVNADGTSSFGGAMTVNGALTVTGILSAEINTTGTAKSGKFSTLTAATFTCDGASTLTGDTLISGNLTMGSGKSLAIPNGSVSAATITVSDRVISDIYTAATGRTAEFQGRLVGSAQKLTTPVTLSVAGVVYGSSVIGFDGSAPCTIPTYLTDGVIKDRHLAADADINDSKLKTITTAGKVADSATSATSLNSPNTIVRRNASGDFTARQITAETFNGTATYATALTTGSLSTNYTWSGQHYFKNPTSSGGITSLHPFPLACLADNGAAAAMSFYIPSNYGINLGLDNDKIFKLGGWSDVNSTRWTADTAGNFTARGNVTAYSDDKLKKNWKNLGTDIVSQIAALKSGTFDRIDSGSRQVGVSAQSLKQILPEAVMEDGDGTMSVAYGNAALALCVELAKEIVQLKKVIAERV